MCRDIEDLRSEPSSDSDMCLKALLRVIKNITFIRFVTCDNHVTCYYILTKEIPPTAMVLDWSTGLMIIQSEANTR